MSETYLEKGVQVACIPELIETSWPVLTRGKDDLSSYSVVSVSCSESVGGREV
jgi:hypothetical protein